MTNKNIYTFEELKNERRNRERCAFCAELNTSVYILRTRRIRDNRLMSFDYSCNDCKEKINGDELMKCSNCERIYRWIDHKTSKDRWECKCIYLKSIGDNDENTDEEKEPTQDSQLEKQLYELSLEKSEVEEELETEREAHLAGVDATADWYKRLHAKELEESEKSRKRLSDENKQLKLQLETTIQQKQKLQELLEKCKCNLQTQIEVPLKN